METVPGIQKVYTLKNLVPTKKLWCHIKGQQTEWTNPIWPWKCYRKNECILPRARGSLDFLFQLWLPWAIVSHWEWHPRTRGIPPFLSKLSFLIWFQSLTQLILVKIASCLNNRATHHPLCDQTGAGEKCLHSASAVAARTLTRRGAGSMQIDVCLWLYIDGVNWGDAALQ